MSLPARLILGAAILALICDTNAASNIHLKYVLSEPMVIKL